MNAAGASNVSPTSPTRLHGYQWKCLFLPDSTELRMSRGTEFFYARVVGDAIVYQGRRVSPRQLTMAIAGDGRNAWRDIWLLLPGESKWKVASLLRRELERQGPPPSPVETIAAVAAAMKDALNTALKLVDHANAQSVPKYERRVERHRRAEDFMIDDCLND